MFYKTLFFIINIFPNLKKFCWKLWYNFISKRFRNDYFKFMNYGYFEENFKPFLQNQDEKERYPIQLYHHLSEFTNLKGLKVLEVGSGRGGGASYIAKTFFPELIIGVDISSNAIDLCNDSFKYDNLSFIQGDSENLPFEDNYFDVIINVESSHCYPSIPNFINEVTRVLKSGGDFLYCDLLVADKLTNHLKLIQNNQLVIVKYNDITDNIIKASELMTNDRNELIENVKSSLLKRILSAFASVKGSKIYESFVNRHYIYITAHCKKN